MENLSCGQVIALLSFYIDEKLNSNLMKNIEYHLNTCSFCRNKYMQLRKIYDNYADIKSRIEEDNDEYIVDDAIYRNQQYEFFKENLSAYIDNELKTEDNLRVKKAAIINPIARTELKNMLLFQQTLHMAFQKTKNNLKKDFSGGIIYKIRDSLPKFNVNSDLSAWDKLINMLSNFLKSRGIFSNGK